MNTAGQDLPLGPQLCPSAHPAECLTRVPWLLLLLISLGLFVLMLAILVQGQSGQGWGRGTGMWNPFRLFCGLFVCFGGLSGLFFFYFVYYFIFAIVKQELQHGTLTELLDFPSEMTLAEPPNSSELGHLSRTVLTSSVTGDS